MLISTRPRRSLLVVSLLGLSAGCASVSMPSYEPRMVAIPEGCEALIQRAATDGVATLTDGDARTVEFCQHQQLLRAAEEEAAARKLDSHARAASLGLQVVTLVVGTTIAVLAWAL